MAKKAEVKETVKKTTTKKVEAAEAKAPAKKTTTRVKTAVYVQYAGIEKSVDELIAAAKKAITVKAKDIAIYVKPEDNAAYYVVNGGEEAGKIEL